MLKLEMVPVLLRMAAKIDIRPLIQSFSDSGALKGNETDREKLAAVAFTAAADLLPQLGQIGGDLVELVAANRGVTVQEAKQMDAIKELKELLTDTGVLGFFTKLLTKNSGQSSLASLLPTLGKQ
jgi:hypothetical protein